jgi:ferredoxin-NADP reductase/Pyruvate/2-oxoacid:ferredoxin oxidoreductase delta subunit
LKSLLKSFGTVTYSRSVAWVKASLLLGFTVVKSAVVNSLILAFVYGPRDIFLWFYHQKQKRGEPLYVEDIPGSKKLPQEFTQEHSSLPEPPSPGDYDHPFKSRIMRQGRYPNPKFTLQYRKLPLSGKILAGVGETTPRRVKKFFHAGYNHVYGAINLAFHLINAKETQIYVQKARWDNRLAQGPVAIRQLPIDDPSEMTSRLKAKSFEFGAALVGCTRVTEETLYEGCESYWPHAVVVAAPMDCELLFEAPSITGDVGAIKGYIDVGKAAIKLAKYIRSLGWNAEADTNLGNAPSKVMHVPLAVNAGLGTMGRHTSVITKEYGANVRFATVLTDIPMIFDEPVDIGVEDVCTNCRVCAENCPPKAIYPEKVMVRGVEKWHLDFDRCMPYFVENEGCGVCITVCPWSESEKAPLLSMLQQHRRRVQESYPEELPVSERLVTLAEDQSTNQAKKEAIVEDYWQEAVIERKTDYPGHIIELILGKATGDGRLPTWSAGAHTEIRLPSGRVRAYSLSNAPSSAGRYRLAIKVEKEGTGGSREVETLREGQSIMVKRPGNNFLLQEDHHYYYLIAGGIGVTPLVPMANRLCELGKAFEVHYSVKERPRAIYAAELEALSRGRLHIHEERGWLENLFDERPESTAVYVCGPVGLMDAVQDKATGSGLPEASVYREDFGSTESDKPFDLILASSGQRITIEPGQTISRALDERGVYTPVSCGYGICGVCTAGVLKGKPDARDQILAESEKESKITLCCSRSLTDELVIDL